MTQILVIFVIRTSQRCWRSRPDRLLVLTSLGALGAGIALALGPFAHVLGFVPLSPTLLMAIVSIAIVYLALAEVLKSVAMMGRTTRNFRPRHRSPGR